MTEDEEWEIVTRAIQSAKRRVRCADVDEVVRVASEKHSISEQQTLDVIEELGESGEIIPPVKMSTLRVNLTR